MSSLKEQNGKYYQEVEVVMLATENQSTIGLDKEDNKLFTYYSPQKSLDYNISQHLYFLSDDEPKVDDYVLSTYDKWKGTSSLKPQLGKIISITDDYYLIDSFNGDTDNRWDKGHSKKIIVTTDESLQKDNWLHPEMTISLPKPSDSFIRKYIEQYNAGRQITKVLVEHDVREYRGHIATPLKVDSNNNVTITKLKDNYSRDEVNLLLFEMYNLGYRHALDELKDRPYEITKENWIKEKL